MESAFTCLALLAAAGLLVPFVLVIAHARKIKTIEIAIQKLTQRIAQLEAHPPAGAETAPPVAASIVPPVVTVPPATTPPAPITPPPIPARTTAPPPIPTLPSAPAVRPPSIAPSVARTAIDWEAFMGVKLFAWIGGFALFLGVVFLVKYSFENNLITPFMRVVVGAIIGVGLVAAGWFTGRRNYRVPGQSLCATGVLVLYADIFGAHAFYNLILLSSAFAFMSLVTVGAFLLAVRLNAPVVVVLGLLGGFLTPPLLTSGNENPLLLFGYVALLNAGIAAVALRKRWDYLLALAAIGTVLTELGWLPAYDLVKAAAGFPVFLAMQAQFLGFAYLRQRLQPAESWSTPAAALTGFASLGFAFWLLTFAQLAQRPSFFFSFAFLADVGLLSLAMWRPNPSRIAGAAGATVFALFAAWTAGHLRHDQLWWALGAYLLFALIHAGFSVWPAKTEPKAVVASWQTYVPLLALGLLFLCVWNGETSFAVWLCVLLIDIVALGLAWRSASLAAVVVALLATVVTAGLWIVTAPPLEESAIGILMVVGGFGVFFSAAATLLARTLGIASETARNVPALAAAMPFVLLLMLVAKLPAPDPTAVFGVAMVLAIVLLGLGIVSRTSWIAAIALAFTWAVERQWDYLHFTNSAALLALGWYVAFFLIFAAYAFFSAEERSPLPWAIGALAGFLHFWLIVEVVVSAYPHLDNGFLPAVFVLPYLFGVWRLIRKRGIAPASGDARLAWQGGAALFFISLVFPFQFEREWITLGWALEGLALLWLFRSAPNGGLRIVGTGMLCLAFVRLALNPAVLEYHRRAPLRIWNWHLYAYGITSVCLLGGARLVQPYRETTLARVIPRLLYTLGIILTFLLLNIEIADYFSVGPTLTFSFEGNFARDMTYSIAWALFAFALLLIGMKKKIASARYAALALIAVTLMKLFLHDLGNLGQLYRIGAFIGVAIILIVASFVYQRFLAPVASTPSKD